MCQWTSLCTAHPVSQVYQSAHSQPVKAKSPLVCLVQHGRGCVLHGSACGYSPVLRQGKPTSHALACPAGAKTGRSPRDKRVVREPSSERDIWWASSNEGSPNYEMDDRCAARHVGPRRAYDNTVCLPRAMAPQGYPADVQKTPGRRPHPRAHELHSSATLPIGLFWPFMHDV